MPNLQVLHHFSPHEDRRLRKLVAAGKAAQKVGELCLAYPQALARAPQVWGQIIRLCERFVPIRDALLVAASQWKADQHYYGDVHPFVLNLPNEVSLLPPVLDCLVSVRLPTRYPRDQSKTVVKLMQEFLPSVNPLLSLITEAEAPEHRGAAALMCLLHPACPEERHVDCITAIVKNYTPHANSWYLRAAAVALQPLIVEEEMTAIEAMGSLLRAGSADFDARLGLNFAFERLRQRSNAPVTQYGIAKF